MSWEDKNHKKWTQKKEYSKPLSLFARNVANIMKRRVENQYFVVQVVGKLQIIGATINRSTT